MGRHLVPLPDLVIATGATDSPAIGIGDLHDAEAIGFQAPSTVDGTVTLEVEMSPTGTNFSTLRTGGSDITLTASKADVITEVTFARIRVHQSVAAAATRTYKVCKQSAT